MEINISENRTQTNKDTIHRNSKRVYHDYKVGDKFNLNISAAFKYETPYKGQFEIKRCWRNGMVTLYFIAINIRYIIRRIKPYTYDTNVEDIKH